MRIYLPDQKDDSSLMADIINYMYDYPKVSLKSYNNKLEEIRSEENLTNVIEVFSYLVNELNKNRQVLLIEESNERFKIT
ncbi:MAG: hypothetical protein R3321_03355 [Nitrososphaeraceae archaeon]|nr:hypothetical protein [Nitrososphaeraceae archaeon]